MCECLSIAKLQPELMQYWCSSLDAELDPKATGVGSHKRVWWEHVCVDGRLRRRQLKVYSVVQGFKTTGRFPCADCAGKVSSEMMAKNNGRLN